MTHPKLRRSWNARKGFLAQFVQPGDLVFDVGANVGDYTQTFVELGARPVALEPAPGLAEVIRRRAPEAVVLDVAASDRAGTTMLHLGRDAADATVSIRYAHVLTDELGIDLHPVTVETVTLDSVADTYGIPAFVKIDVEGHEYAVLQGMTFTPDALSIEIHSSLLDEAAQCLALLEERGYTFRLSMGFSMCWSGGWQTAQPLLDTFRRLAGGRGNAFADVYAQSAPAFVVAPERAAA